jgi:tetratricopeptide (TPR) repeat protein
VGRGREGGPPTLENVIARADELKAAGRLADAARAYEAWIADNDTPARCVALFNLGVLRSDIGDVEGAEAAYGEAVALNPRFHQARINAGLVAGRQCRSRTSGSTASSSPDRS